MTRPAPPPRARRRVPVLAGCAVLLGLLLGAHQLVPDVGGLGTAIDSFLPWLGLGVPVLGVLALVRRSRVGAVALLVPVLVWGAMFGPALVRGPAGGSADLRVVSQNVFAGNTEPEATAADLIKADADVVGLQEIAYTARERLLPALDDAYPLHVTMGTVGLWSRYPILDSRPVDLGLGWTRALRATVRTPQGELVVYVAHLGSIRLGSTGERDGTLRALAAAVNADPASKVLVLGDLNTASTDRALGRAMPSLQEAQNEAGSGLGFTWPAAFPLTRPDHVLYRGLTATDAGTLHTRGSDHRAATAGLRL
ncbi:endonuclease [Solihabitans fulvus]|uniref:Endonuclease n=1 Tax=Solihabitans fulvus TaxID=1892852 RepID=A0A5B2XPU6_9PSEU|nr:endonuclease [Solihabitans fulvus]